MTILADADNFDKNVDVDKEVDNLKNDMIACYVEMMSDEEEDPAKFDYNLNYFDDDDDEEEDNDDDVVNGLNDIVNCDNSAFDVKGAAVAMTVML